MLTIRLGRRPNHLIPGVYHLNRYTRNWRSKGHFGLRELLGDIQIGDHFPHDRGVDDFLPQRTG